MLDHRLVQTAVIGHKNSDHPVILPMDAWELDRWRKAHPGYSYWCGLQLGGCGGELSDRRYTTKVCHFAHHSTAPVCHRKNNGESSADHLFIKRGVQRLLGKRKVKGRVETRDLGTGPGDVVDVYLPDSRRRLRFQLGAVDYRAWRRADDELAADADGMDWIFSSEGPITQQFVGRHGYCLRVRCETVGGERRVHIGAEARDRTVSWTPLEECAVTSSGIATPETEKIRLVRPRPTVLPLQGGLVFALDPEADVPAGSGGPAPARGRCEARGQSDRPSAGVPPGRHQGAAGRARLPRRRRRPLADRRGNRGLGGRGEPLCTSQRARGSAHRSVGPALHSGIPVRSGARTPGGAGRDGDTHRGDRATAGERHASGIRADDPRRAGDGPARRVVRSRPPAHHDHVGDPRPHGEP